MQRTRRGVFVVLLDGTFSTLSRTWLTSLLVGGVLFIAPAIFFGWAYGSLVDALSRAAGPWSAEDAPPILAVLGKAYLWLLLAVLAQGLAFLFVRACVTEQTARAARAQDAGVPEAGTSLRATLAVAAHILREKYHRLLGQRLLQYAIVGITIAAGAVLATLAIALGMAVKSDAVAVVLGLALGLGGCGAALWISFRYAVTLESLVVDGTGIEGSLDASMDLVRRRWWTVFGCILLLTVIVSFASSLLATPIMFFSTIRPFMQALQEVLHDRPGSGGLDGSILKLLAGMGRRFAILQYVQSLLGGFAAPVFMTLLFLELKKARQPGTTAADGEPATDEAPAPVSGAVAVPPAGAAGAAGAAGGSGEDLP